jgi:thioesterase domain-containing protein/acyl carrier protein
MERLRQLNGLPTGFPVANTRFQVIDRKGKPALVGVAGELCVEGDGLPAGTELLRTGEIARIRSDGIIERAVQADEQPPEETSVQPETRANTGAATTAIEQRVAAIWCSIFELSVIDIDANFFELGGHSLLAARMLARIEGEFGRRITLASLFRAPTIQGLSRALATESRHYDFRQVVKLQANGSRTPLIAINNTGVYYLLAKRLGAEQPVVSLQLFDPSFNDQVMPDSLEKLAAEYVKLIHRVQPAGPYLLMGWCVAGALTFEIARQLAAANQEIRELFLMDSWVPRYFKRQTAWKRVIGERSLRWQFLRVDWHKLMRGEDSFERFLNKRTGLQSLLKRFRRKDAETGEVAAPSSPENYDQWLLAFLEGLTTRYEPQRYPGKVTLFRSLQEPTGWLFDPLAGWGRFADSVELHLVAGNHFSMFQEPGVAQIAAQMATLLEKPAAP